MGYIKWRYLIINISIWWFVKCLDIANKLEFVSNDCQLVEPIYNFTFNFNPLHSELAHKIESEKGDIFEFNVCGNLTKQCSGHTNVAACLTKKGKQYVLGINQQLEYKNGRIYFTFMNGEECKPGRNYSLNVLVSCDYTLDKKLFLVMPYETDECTFYILWETPYACLPEPDNIKSNTCMIEDKKTGHIFNLLPLSESNYRAIDRNGSYFIINVCKPVLYGQNSMCPPGSSVCFVNQTVNDYRKKFYNYGTVQPNPIIENGQLLMRHPSDTICNSTHNITSTIYFLCDSHTKYGEPIFIRRKECEYKFRWETSIACKKTKPCTIIDSNTGFEYDFSSLENNKYVTVSKDGKEYSIGICSDPGNPCLEHTGVCEQKDKQSISLGITSNQLHFNQTGAPYLLYENGAVCSGNVMWSTKIELICENNENKNNNLSNDYKKINEKNQNNNNTNENSVKIIENSKCQILIQFQTQLACQKQLSCKAKGYSTSDMNEEIDLTPLISSTQNYIAIVNDSLKLNNKNSIKFFLNVCRPLVPEYGLGCSGGSAACKTVMGKNTPEQEQSLGYPDVSLTVIEKSRAILKYLRGDQCPTDTSIQLSSSIEFYCDYHAGKGIPILQSIADDCYYQFYWATSVICSSNLCKFNMDTCEIINEKLNENYKLKSANFMSNGKLTIKENIKVIDICNDVSERSVLADYAHNMVKMFFNTKVPCENDGTINVELRLVCSAIEHHSSSNDDGLCSFVVIQETPEICKFLGIFLKVENESDKSNPTTTTRAVPTKEKQTNKNENLVTKLPEAQAEVAVSSTPTTQKAIPDNNKGHNENNDKILTTAGVVLTILTISLILCLWMFRDERRRKKFKRWFRKDTPRVQYSRVETSEEANVLLLHEGHITDSDEEMLT